MASPSGRRNEDRRFARASRAGVGVAVVIAATSACGGAPTSTSGPTNGAPLRPAASAASAAPHPVVSAITPNLVGVPVTKLVDPTEPTGALRVIDNGLPDGAPPYGASMRLGAPYDQDARGALSPDGSLLALQVEDQPVALFDAKTGKLVRVIGKPEDAGKSHYGATFSPDGKRVAIQIGGDSSTSLRLVDAQTGKTEHEIPTGRYAVNDPAFSPDGASIAWLDDSYDQPENLVVVDTASGAVTKEVVAAARDDAWTRFAIGKGATFVALSRGGEHGSLEVRDRKTKKVVLKVEAASYIDQMVFSSEGDRLAVTSSNQLRVWRIPSGELAIDKKLDMSTSFLAFAPNGGLVVLDFLDALLAVDAGGTLTRRYRREGLSVDSIGFTADGELVSHTGNGIDTTRWIASTGQPIVYTATRSTHAERIRFATNDQRLFGFTRADVEVWDTKSGKIAAIEQGAAGPIAVAKDVDPKIDWEAFDSTARGIGGRLGEVRSVGGKTRALVWQDRKLRVTEPPRIEPIVDLENATLPVAHLLADGSGLLVGGYDDPWRILDLPSGKERVALDGGGPLRFEDAIVSPDGKLVFGRRESATSVDVFRASDGQPVGQMKNEGGGGHDDGDSAYVMDIALSPNGKWLVAASSDHVARVFSTSSRALVTTLDGHADLVEGVAFSNDGSTIATVSRDGTLLLWPTAGKLP